MRKVPFTAEHLFYMDTILGPPKPKTQLVAWGEKMVRFLPNVTFVEGDLPVASGGLVIMWTGMAEAWLCLSAKSGFRIVVEVKRQLQEWIDQWHLHRVQSEVDCSFEKGVRFLEWLGMKREGRLEAFGPNREDFFLYARVINGARSS